MSGKSEELKSKKSVISERYPTFYTAEIALPEVEDYSFNFRKLWAFTGPGFLMSIAYIDPGNIESDLQVGTIVRYKLLWILVSSTVLSLLMQRLAARLGVVTGKHLAEICHRRYPKVPRLLLWIMIEVSIIGTDMQEVIGTAIAIFLLSNRLIPLWIGVLVTIFDTITFLLLDRYGLRKLEAFFGLFIAIMAGTAGYELFKVGPEPVEMIKGLVIPYCIDCDNNALFQAIGIIGAIIMPHNLYLHSALIKSRQIKHNVKEEVNDANRYVFIESAIAMGISLIINIAVTSVFAHGLYGRTNREIYETCISRNDSRFDINAFSNDTEEFDADIYKAGVFLGCQFGLFSMYIWAIGILAGGQSSTMTGTYAGQFVMEGFLNLKWPGWQRILFTRLIAIGPTLIMTMTSDMNHLTEMNDYLNVLMSLQIPFALLPALTFSSSRYVMGDFANGITNKIIASLLAVVVIGINIYFVIDLVIEKFAGNLWAYILFAIYGVYYVTFIAYLSMCCLVALGLNGIQFIPRIGSYFKESEQIEYKYNEEFL